MTGFKILITGSGGQLGSEIRSLAPQFPAIEFTFTNRHQLKIDDSESIESYFAKNKFTHCINCAAYTAVDKAEEEAEKAFLLNSSAVKNIALACSASNVTLVHISTDYVFDGKAIDPYKEIDQTNPVNLYGASKLEGERLALLNNENTIIIRTSWLYSVYGKNFVKTMMRLMNEKESIGVVADQVGCPTHARDLAAAVLKIITEHQLPAPGIYHYCNRGVISWFQFATAIKEIIQSPCQVKAIRTDEYPTPAKRPFYSAFDTSKIQAVFGIVIPDWKDSLKECISLTK